MHATTHKPALFLRTRPRREWKYEGRKEEDTAAVGCNNNFLLRPALTSEAGLLFALANTAAHTALRTSRMGGCDIIIVGSNLMNYTGNRI